MNQKEVQIKGSLSIIEKNVKELKTSLSNLLNQSKLSQKNGIRLYNFSSGASSTNQRNIEILCQNNLSTINSIKKEIDRIEAEIRNISNSNSQNNNQMNQSITINPKSKTNISVVSNQRPSMIKKDNFVNSSLLVRPSNIKSSFVPNSSFSRPVQSNNTGFKPPAPKTKTFGVNTSISLNPKNTLNSSRLVNTSIVSNSWRKPIHVNSIPKPNVPINSSISTPNQPKRSIDPHSNIHQLTSNTCIAHSVDASKQPLGNCEKDITPIKMSKSYSSTTRMIMDDSPHISPTKIPHDIHTMPVDDQEIQKMSEIQISNLREINENIDPKILEKIGDQTIAECYALLEKTNLN